MRKVQNTAYEARDMGFQIWDCPKEGTLRLPNRAIKIKPLCH